MALYFKSKFNRIIVISSEGGGEVASIPSLSPYEFHFLFFYFFVGIFLRSFDNRYEQNAFPPPAQTAFLEDGKKMRPRSALFHLSFPLRYGWYITTFGIAGTYVTINKKKWGGDLMSFLIKA